MNSSAVRVPRGLFHADISNLSRRAQIKHTSSFRQAGLKEFARSNVGLAHS